MSQAAKRGNGSRSGKADRRSGPRKAAEWVSLGLAALLLLSMASYLVQRAAQPESDYVAAEVRLLMDEVRQEKDLFILPVEMRNPSRRALRDLHVDVEYRDEKGEPATREIEIDYLGAGSRQQTYLYFDRHPRELQVEATPTQYRLD